MLAIVRREFPHRRVIAECRIENVASMRLLENLRFRTEDRAGRRPGRTRFALE
jgi:RimJ/RimL family protein N-acetyltransferase